MTSYSLKNTINVTKEYVDELITKSWQDIDNLKNQISCIDSSSEYGKAVLLLLNELLTNYYIFTGCLENINISSGSEDVTNNIITATNVAEPVHVNDDTIESKEIVDSLAETEYDDNFEPFEYFVDFDEPVGEKLTDADLYNI